MFIAANDLLSACGQIKSWITSPGIFVVNQTVVLFWYIWGHFIKTTKLKKKFQQIDELHVEQFWGRTGQTGHFSYFFGENQTSIPLSTSQRQQIQRGYYEVRPLGLRCFIRCQRRYAHMCMSEHVIGSLRGSKWNRRTAHLSLALSSPLIRQTLCTARLMETGNHASLARSLARLIWLQSTLWPRLKLTLVLSRD